MNSSSHGQAASNGRDSLREVLIRISAETAGAELALRQFLLYEVLPGVYYLE